MRKILIVAFYITCLFGMSNAQVLMTPFGASATNGSQSSCYTSGEVVIRTIEDSDENITQGFQQPEIIGEEIELEIFNGIVIGDQGNNTLFIKDLEKYPNNSITVLNRWGETVYEASPYENDWQGRFQNQYLPAATYYFILNLDVDNDNFIHGNVYILNK